MKTVMLLFSVFCCGWAAAGTTEHKIKHGGLERTYRVYAPAKLEAGKKYPLILLLHGGGGTGRGMQRLTRGWFERKADAAGAILAYPDAWEKHWNDYRGDRSRASQRENVDDVAFLSAMADEIAGRLPVDPARVYSTGISNGAMMSYTLACRAAGKFAAVAPVAGAMPESQAASCRPARPVPVLIISGTEDKLVHWGGGDVTGPFGRQKLGRTISVEKSRDLWLGLNGCDSGKKTSVKIDADPDDGTSVTRESYSCAGGAVEFLRVDGGGHTWPGGLQYRSARVIGRTSRELDASSEIWDFFMRHRLPEGK